mgnify:CR=1 FL=1
MNAPLRQTTAAQKLMIVDCDIHPIQHSQKDLYPWLSKRWIEHYETFGPHVRVGINGSQVYPRMTYAGQRADAYPSNGGPPGCDLELMQRQHLDPVGVEWGMLVSLSKGGMEEGESVEEALKHPTWSMGPKITVDSSTLMNKGLEVIEAHELFGFSYDQVDVVVHPQSIVHSMVEFTDAAVIAQLSMPDMRLPIAYAIGFPGRGEVPYGRIDWTSLSRLDFQAPDRKTFRCLDLAYQAGRIGGTAPAWLSAANEVAVEAFLSGATSWWSIADIIEETLQHHDAQMPTTVEDILQADATARRVAREVLNA